MNGSWITGMLNPQCKFRAKTFDRSSYSISANFSSASIAYFRLRLFLLRRRDENVNSIGGIWRLHLCSIPIRMEYIYGRREWIAEIRDEYVCSHMELALQYAILVASEFVAIFLFTSATAFDTIYTFKVFGSKKTWIIRDSYIQFYGSIKSIELHFCRFEWEMYFRCYLSLDVGCETKF